MFIIANAGLFSYLITRAGVPEMIGAFLVEWLKSPALFLLMRIRDEAHRFAITFHRELARKAAIESGLDSIEGIGPKRKKALVKKFGSPKGVKLASADDLASVEGISHPVARRIFEHFATERAEILARQAAQNALETGGSPPAGNPELL